MEEEYYKSWEDKYRNKKIVDFSKYLTPKYIDILKRLQIEIRDEIYTEYEFHLLEQDILLFYRDEANPEPTEIEKDYNLEEKKVSKKEYYDLLKRFSKIARDYDF